LGRLVAQVRDELHLDVSAWFLIFGHASALHVAMARENREQAEVAAASLRTLLSAGHRRAELGALEAYVHDDPAPLQGKMEVSEVNTAPFSFGFAFCLERGVLPSPQILAVARGQATEIRSAMGLAYLAEANALEAGDMPGLALAIDQSEAFGLAPHAARMRIVLANLTGDPRPLARASPVLESLQDRQFLKRLQNVELALAAASRSQV
jgi:hypothetical protein